MDRPAEYSGNINDLRNSEEYLDYGREFSVNVNDLTPPPSESGAFPHSYHYNLHVNIALSNLYLVIILKSVNLFHLLSK